MAEKIGPGNRTVGAGFFDAGGRLKPPEIIKKEDAGGAPAVRDSTSVFQPPDSGVRSVQARTSRQISAALEMNAETRQTLREAKEISTKKINILKELKNNSSDDARRDELKAAYRELEKESGALAERVEAYNGEAVTAERSISVGNKNYGGEFRQQRIDYDAGEAADLDSAEGVAAALKDTKTQRDAVTAQLESARAQRDEIGKAAHAALKDIKSLETVAPRLSDGEATSLAKQLAETVRSSTVESAMSAFNEARAGGIDALKTILNSLSS